MSWIYQTGISRLGSFETSPVVVDGVMYVTTPYDTAMAVDARTGNEIWRYEHKLGTKIFCCGPNNRGVAVSGTTVYMLTLDARLVALDAQTARSSSTSRSPTPRPVTARARPRSSSATR